MNASLCRATAIYQRLATDYDSENPHPICPHWLLPFNALVRKLHEQGVVDEFVARVNAEFRDRTNVNVSFCIMVQHPMNHRAREMNKVLLAMGVEYPAEARLELVWDGRPGEFMFSEPRADDAWYANEIHARVMDAIAAKEIVYLIVLYVFPKKADRKFLLKCLGEECA